ncbi:MAG: 1,4-dihydroxy-2-naphthoate polyprenyltransferase [Anaerolineales bacterium]|nr:1,4-dihydroxy-2-naphthoate polyprenyltransferase [Anaerolineales bacterium]
MMAIRPRTLPAAAAGIVMGAALTWRDGNFRIDAVLVCLLTALLLQIGSNLANDVFDFERGTDTAKRLGPTRVTQAGLLTPKQVKTGMIVVFGLAILLGLYLVWLGGWIIIILGVVAIASAIAYTGGPFPIGYHGLGDIFVFIFFGVVSVTGTYFIQAGTITPVVWLMTIPPGLIVTAILVVNNLRDIDNDRKAGKYTLAVRFGEKATKIQYTVCIVAAYLILIPVAWVGLIPWTVLLAWVSLPIAFQATKVVLTQKGRPLNAALAKTGQTALAFSLLFWLGLLLQK